jgi:hypothetical protein
MPNDRMLDEHYVTEPPPNSKTAGALPPEWPFIPADLSAPTPMPMPNREETYRAQRVLADVFLATPGKSRAEYELYNAVLWKLTRYAESLPASPAEVS